MDADRSKVIQFLEGNKQFTIPLYQRKYSWTTEQCRKLLDDLVKTGGNDDIDSHFLGSVVSMPVQTPLTTLTRLMIIDGQQRITTVSLLIIVLIEFLRKIEESPVNPDKLLNSYIVNQYEEGADKYKLLLTEDDKLSYIDKVDNLYRKNPIKSGENDSISKIRDNYRFFKRNIKEDNYMDVYNGLQKLIIIHVGLEYGKDNPQLIFESLNSTGLELSNADLIRNYILMGLEKDEQERLYNDYWHRMEVTFEESEQKNLFDRFIKDYLTIKLKRIPTNRAVYQEFKDFSIYYGSVEDLVEDVYKYAQYYFNIVLDKEPDPELRYKLTKFNQLGFDITRPFLLKIYEDYDNEKITSEDFIEIIDIIESYLIRRLICDIPTPSLNKTFADLYYEMDENNYIQSLEIALLIKDKSKRFPNDLEFRENFLVKDIYNSRINEYILKNIEEYLNPKEQVDTSNLTIEHIMPQNPDAQSWKEDLGTETFHELQKQYLHTIGNLTLTGYNTEYADKGFNQKQNMKGGYKDSTINLNKGLRELTKWDEEEIIKRAEKLHEISEKIWSYPNVEQEAIQEYKKKHEIELGKKNKKPVGNLYIEYWTLLTQYIKEHSINLPIKEPRRIRYYDMPISKGAHISLQLNSIKKHIATTIYINSDKELYDNLHDQKEEIEDKLGYKPDWINSSNKKNRQIKLYNNINPLDKDEWENAIQWHLQTAEKFKEVFEDRIKQFSHDKIKAIIGSEKPEHIEVTCDIPESDKKAHSIYYTNENKIIILKGSYIREKPLYSFPKELSLLRENLLKYGIIDENFCFTKDYVFSSPSYAAAFVRGIRSGRDDWYKIINNEKVRLNELIK